MQKRQLPNRLSRGKVPERHFIPQIQQKIQKIVSKNDPIQRQKRQLQMKRKNLQIMNLKKYPFCRAYHYFFDLDNFARIANSLTYVDNSSNVFSLNFSKQQTVLKSNKIGQIMNRNLFGLPINTSGNIPNRKQNKCKNVCYGYLFDTQDKKYNLERLIYIYKLIIKRIQKDKNIDDLFSIENIRKQQAIVQIVNINLDKQQKLNIIKQKLQTLQHRKNNNIKNWLNQDFTYYYHSLNQKFHDAVFQLKNYINFQTLCNNLIQNKLNNQIKYYFSNKKVISQQIYIQNNPFMCIYYEDYKNLFKFIGPIIARKCLNLNQINFYEVKDAIQKIFGQQIILKSIKYTNYDIFYKNFKRKNEQIRKWRKNNKILLNNLNSYPNLDNELNNNLSSFTQKIELTGHQYQMSIICFWLIKIFYQLKPLIQKFPQILSIISSQYYPKICNSLVQSINLPIAGLIFYALQAIGDIFVKPDPLVIHNKRLSWRFNQKLGVGIMWIQDNKLNKQNDQNEMTPIKKTKLY